MLAVEPAIAYADPWRQPLRERLGMLNRRRRRVAYFYEEANNSTFRYRAYNMVQVLQAFGEPADVSAGYFFLSDYAYFDEIADAADVLVICRSRYGAALSQLIAKFRARGRRVLFDIDDLVFNPDYVRLVVKTLGLNACDDLVWEQWFAMVSRLGATLRQCDGAIGTNELLAARLREYSGLPVAVVPNFLNREQLEISESIFRRRSAAGAEDERVFLGYFSGSPSHRLDYAIVEDAVAEVMRADPRVHLVVVGYIEPTESMKPLQHRVIRFPFQDYVNLQRLIGAVHLNLMPLQVNDFTDCKSELKFFDAAIVGTSSIASPSYTYRNVIEHGRTGYLARAHEWVQMIRQAIEQLPRSRPMVEAARQIARERFCWDRQLPSILSAVGLERADQWHRA